MSYMKTILFIYTKNGDTIMVNLLKTKHLNNFIMTTTPSGVRCYIKCSARKESNNSSEIGSYPIRVNERVDFIERADIPSAPLFPESSNQSSRNNPNSSYRLTNTFADYLNNDLTPIRLNPFDLARDLSFGFFKNIGGFIRRSAHKPVISGIIEETTRNTASSRDATSGIGTICGSVLGIFTTYNIFEIIGQFSKWVGIGKILGPFALPFIWLNKVLTPFGEKVVSEIFKIKVSEGFVSIVIGKGLFNLVISLLSFSFSLFVIYSLINFLGRILEDFKYRGRIPFSQLPVSKKNSRSSDRQN